MNVNACLSKLLHILYYRELDEQWARFDAKHAASALDYDEEDYNTFEDVRSQCTNCDSLG